MHINRSNKLIIFQLYLFVLKSFFDITAKDINDSCYDISQLESGKTKEQQLIENKDLEKRIEIITDFLYTIFQTKKEKLDFTIKQAIELILNN